MTHTQRAFHLNVEVRQGPPNFELLNCEGQSLLVGINTFFALDLCLHFVDDVTRLSSSFQRVAITTDDTLHKNQIVSRRPETAKKT